MSKNKLAPSQKQLLSNLEWFVARQINWKNKNKSILNDAVEDGRYAVFLSYDNCEEKDATYDVVVCSQTMYGASMIAQYNTFSYCQVVDLFTLEVMQKIKKLYTPTLDNFIEKMEQQRNVL